MASVSSLDQDMRRLRMQKGKDPAAIDEATRWIEEALGRKLPPVDLMDALKDGVILCEHVSRPLPLCTQPDRLANLAIPPPGLKFKKDASPFVQMENISKFLTACQQRPINLAAHDRFLTVDLFEKKDPAQVLQCLAAFSRVVQAMAPGRIRTCIGPKKSAVKIDNGQPSSGPMRDSRSNNAILDFPPKGRPPPLSPKPTAGSSPSPPSNETMSPQSVSTWSRRSDEHATSPAWNIAQYGYMGGANQSSQGVVYGARRQITSARPHVPSLLERDRKRQDEDIEASRIRTKERGVNGPQRAAHDLEGIGEEEGHYGRKEEARVEREQGKKIIEEQDREWREQDYKWKVDGDTRLVAERKVEGQREEESRLGRTASSDGLQGKSLREKQPGNGISPRSRRVSRNDPELEAERRRVADLERQLAEAKERERQYQRERNNRIHGSRPSTCRPPSPPESNVSWTGDEREHLGDQCTGYYHQEPAISPRPLPDPTNASATLPSPRPLPDPPNQMSSRSSTLRPSPNTADRLLSSNPRPPPPGALKVGIGPTTEHASGSGHRTGSQQVRKPGGWASKSLLEREMERERQRQKEWEESQKRTKATPRDGRAAGMYC